MSTGNACKMWRPLLLVSNTYVGCYRRSKLLPDLIGEHIDISVSAACPYRKLKEKWFSGIVMDMGRASVVCDHVAYW